MRLLGRWDPEDVQVFGERSAVAEELLAAEGATEFSLGRLGPYAVVDLRAAD